MTTMANDPATARAAPTRYAPSGIGDVNRPVSWWAVTIAGAARATTALAVTRPRGAPMRIRRW
jgi:hypothetical protein